ncbi:hypothetical protein HanPSC8_Chr17g0785641 [Helianthus annuus]|nr:hypothetical protein HanPSC8_Chr17g0785641 [Helianthus annuus]
MLSKLLVATLFRTTAREILFSSIHRTRYCEFMSPIHLNVLQLYNYRGKYMFNVC